MKKSRAEQDLFLLLREEYPHATIICQEPIQCGKKTLFLDYYIPSLKMAFEADGRQHTEFVPFFHKVIAGYERSTTNDRMKDRWCEDNGVTLIRFAHNEDVDSQTLRTKIQQTLGKEETPPRRRRKRTD